MLQELTRRYLQTTDKRFGKQKYGSMAQQEIDATTTVERINKAFL